MTFTCGTRTVMMMVVLLLLMGATVLRFIYKPNNHSIAMMKAAKHIISITCRLVLRGSVCGHTRAR